ncbi:MAG: YdcH family protein [Candidatus Lambdaproteobacteria bacterium]|nr:YdcH family protein [Candidatus Lambdaproteobacteria bacterium]
MDQRTLDLIDAARKAHPELESLVSSHHELDAQVSHLTERGHLTPEETLELSRLKKEKLKIRDQIEDILHQKASA